MSALGQKRTFAVHNCMSALPPIADIQSTSAMSALNEFMRRSIKASLFDHLNWGCARSDDGIVTPNAFAVLPS